MGNIVNKLPEVARATLKKLIQKGFPARSYGEAVEQARALIEQYKGSFAGSSWRMTRRKRTRR